MPAQTGKCPKCGKRYHRYLALKPTKNRPAGIEYFHYTGEAIAGMFAFVETCFIPAREVPKSTPLPELDQFFN